MRLFKALIAGSIITLFLTACTSSPEQVKFNEWKKDAYQVESLSYDNSDLKGEAQKELKPVFDKVNTIIPSGRFKVNVDVLKDDNWKRNICKNYVDVTGEQILGVLPDPIIGNEETFTEAGFVTLKQFQKVAEQLNVTIAETDDATGILDGTNAEYGYAPKQYTVIKDTKHFQIILSANSGWNALFWEEYYVEEDPGKMDTKDFAIPSDKYMPMVVKVYYTTACEKL